MNARSQSLRSLLAAIAGLLMLLGTSLPASAHEIRPAYLQLDQTAPSRYRLLWRTPVLSGMRLPVVLRFPAGIRDVAPPEVQELSDSLIERRVLEVGPSGLAGRRIEFVGLEATITQVLVRVQMLDGTHSTTLVRPSQPWVDISASQGTLAVVGTYLRLGIHHILTGVDHLLFVLALVLIVPNLRRLLWTITAFTLAHSLTLAAATLGFVHVPQAPVEAAIALSIVFVAAEIVHGLQGRPGLTARAPWVIAFAFGLLHGFGFAGALAEVGLPPRAIPLALFFFNVGVEIGQILFVATILTVLVLLKRFHRKPLAWAEGIPAYMIGSIAMFWVFARIAAFSGP